MAEGGMAMTNNNNIANKMIRLRSHGISRIEMIMLIKIKMRLGIMNKHI